MKDFFQYRKSLLEANGNAEYNDASVGDIVEGLFACAITAAYLNRGTGIKEADIYKVLNKVVTSRMQAEFKVPDQRVKGVADTVICKINVPTLAEEVLKKIKDYKDKDLLKLNIKNIVVFANTDRRTGLQSKTFSSNGKVDKIEVIADGVGDQKSTKIDVFVKFNDKTSKGSVSLKARSDRISNFDRGPVFDFDTHVGELYKNLIKLPVPNLKKEYDRILKSYKDAAANKTFSGRDDPGLTAAKESIREAISMVSQQIAKDMDKALKKQSYINYLIDMIENAATRKDRNVSILDVSSMKRLRFDDKFARNIRTKKFRAEVLEGGKGPDKTIIYAGSDPILRIRPVIQTNVNKKTGKVRPRVIWTLETQKGITKYASSRN